MEIWEESFRKNKQMWGVKPAPSSYIVRDYFKENNVQELLIPGIGYGRNANPFLECNMNVTGIEISETAIALARSKGLEVTIHHGPVSKMPFDDKQYDGIFSYALLHLLDEKERTQFIQACYDQLKPGGVLAFVTISKNDTMYGQGKQLGENYFAPHPNVPEMKIYFYSKDQIREDFAAYGLQSINEVDEKPRKFWVIFCQKEA